MKALPVHPQIAPPPAGLPWTRQPLARKLAIVTVIKVVGLLVLWWAFFSGSDHRDMTPEQAATAMLHPQASKARMNSAQDPQGNDLVKTSK